MAPIRKKLPIQYNSRLPIGVVSNDPFSYLVYDKLFDDFIIVTDGKKQCLEDLGFGDRTKIIKSSTRTDSPRGFYTAKKFIELTKQQPKRKFITYAPIDPPYKVNPLNLLMNSPAIAHAYENKRYFRDEFADLIRMPKYVIRHVAELDKAAAYHGLREEFDGDFVMQDEESSGSKGTHIIKNHDNYVEAVKAFKKNSSGRSIVISQYIDGEAFSTQVCITKYGIFSGGVQKQLVDSNFLCNTKISGATRWCGGEIGGKYSDIVQHQAHEMATIVGSELASHGYKGIFGIDLIITPDNEVYAIEINARQTGWSFLISDLHYKQGKIPFMLLHALELGNLDYEVKDLDALPSSSRVNTTYSLMIVVNPMTEEFIMKQYVKPGVYKISDDKLVFEKEAYSISQLRGEDRLLIMCRHNKDESVDSGKRILKIIKQGKIMSKNDLNLKSQNIVKIVKRHFELPE